MLHCSFPRSPAFCISAACYFWPKIKTIQCEVFEWQKGVFTLEMSSKWLPMPALSLQ